MNIKEMHYDFKKKINKIDSQQYRNLQVPEIDWSLNEAAEIFVKKIAFPFKSPYRIGIESDQRSIDDIRNVIKDQDDPANLLNVTSNIVTLPSDYWHFISGYALLTKQNCADRRAKIIPRQHDDTFEESYFDRSSFEWRTVNIVFAGNTIRIKKEDPSFLVTKIGISYLKKLIYMHNAEDFRGGTYSLPGQPALAGSVNCELAEHTHREIVDLAVLVATGELQIPDYQTKRAKIDLLLT
jgi:hypothetical protein